MKYSELKKAMRDFNEKHSIERKVEEKYTKDGKLIEMTGQVVFKNSALNQEYQKQYGPFSKESRTFVFSNYNKALTGGDMGYSIFAYCEADHDGMRIENYRDEHVEEAEIISVVE